MSTITEHPRTIDLSQIENEVSDSQNNSNATQDYPVPLPKTDDELVVEIRAIGLNPVDWKSMYACPLAQLSGAANEKYSDYNFAIPQLPYIAGRDFAGVVVRAPAASSRLRIGDLVRVMSRSTLERS